MNIGAGSSASIVKLAIDVTNLDFISDHRILKLYQKVTHQECKKCTSSCYKKPTVTCMFTLHKLAVIVISGPKIAKLWCSNGTQYFQQNMRKTCQCFFPDQRDDDQHDFEYLGQVVRIRLSQSSDVTHVQPHRCLHAR